MATRFRFQKGRAGFATDSNCNHFLRIYIFKKKILKDLDAVLNDTKTEEKTINSTNEAVELYLRRICIIIVDYLNVLFTNSNDSTFGVKRIIFNYNSEDDFFSLLIGVKYNNTLTAIIDIRLEVARACMAVDEYCFFTSNRDTHEPLGNFDTSHVSDEPFKNYDASAVASVLKPIPTAKKTKKDSIPDKVKENDSQNNIIQTSDTVEARKEES
jgi:hypothetical protein